MAQQAADVNNMAYRGRQQALAQEAPPGGAEVLGPGMFPEAWLEPWPLTPVLLPARLGPGLLNHPGSGGFLIGSQGQLSPHISISIPYIS